MKTSRIVLAVVALSAAGCTSPRDNAIEQATEMARNAVGKGSAPVWDQMVCYADEELTKPSYVSGFVNGGKGAQLFLVNFKWDGKPKGEVELNPLQNADASEVGYWIEIDRLRKDDDGKECSDWSWFAHSAALAYWEASRDGASHVEALNKLYKMRRELMKSQAAH